MILNENKMERKKLLQIVGVICLMFVYTNSNAQCGPVGNGTNGGIHCMYPDTSRNCLYAGGGFHNSGVDTMNYCGYWNDSSYVPMDMMGNKGCNDSVWCFTYFNGSLYVGGSFTQAGGVSSNYIARWDGASWYPVGNGFNSSVHSLTVYNNQLYAGGQFTMSGSNSVSHLGYWNGTQWNQVGGGVDQDVKAMCVWNNALYIGGDITVAGGVTVNRICKWDGANYFAVGSGFNSGMGEPCMVRSFCIYNGNLIAGGMFEHSGTSDMHNLAMWNGTTWSSIGHIDGGMMGENGVRTMCAYNNRLFIGGSFSSCGSTSSNNLGMWDGSSWSSIGTGMDGAVNSLAVHHNELYIGGSFTNAAGTSVNNIAKYSANTGIHALNGNSISLTVYPNPAGNYVRLSWVNENLTEVKLTLSDIAGKILFERDQILPSIGIHQEEIPMNDISDGIYMITLNSGERNYSARVVISR